MKSTLLTLSAAFYLVFITSCNKPKISWAEKKADSLVAIMTLEEKIGQMSQVRHFADMQDGDVKTKFIGSVIHTDGPTPGETAEQWQQKMKALQDEALSTRLGIPLLLGVDAIHGLNPFAGATIFPHNIGLGASGNAQLVKDIATATAKETKGCGFNWTFSPCAAIPFNEKWGRVYEAFSENTTLTQNLVAASITGLQGKLGSKGTIMATAKHFIGDGATDYGIEGGNTTVSKQLYNDILLPPYKTAIEHNVGAIMASFNNQHGINMHAHKALITDSLKNKYGFKGIVISDWKGYSRFGKSDVINAGLDMVMAVDGDLDLFQSEMKTFVDDGTVSIDRINDAVRRILIQKIKLGLFKNPYPESTYVKSIGSKAHRKLAKQAVSESLVLLKNDQALPLKPKSKIVIVGQHANNLGLQSGGWTISWQGKPENYPGGTTILQGFNALNNFEIVYDTFGTLAIYDADYAIVCVGEKPYAEFFGDVGHEQSDCELTLDSAQQQYINNYANKGPKLITVLVSGRPMVVTNQIDKSDAFVAAWLPGSEGDGIAEVLSGNSDFKGKLPHTWPKSLDNFKGLYGPNYWNKENIGLFELGYGLSYK